MKGKYDTLRVEEKPGDLLLATLSRPEVANAFNTRAALDLCEFFESLDAERRRHADARARRGRAAREGADPRSAALFGGGGACLGRRQWAVRAAQPARCDAGGRWENCGQRAARGSRGEARHSPGARPGPRFGNAA